MYYFDNKTLAQYMDSGQEIRVFVNSDVFTIPTLNDISNQRQGVGYDEFGNATYFDYRAIEKIEVGGQYLTIDALQTQKTGEPSDEEEPPKNPDKGSDDEADEEEPPKSDKETDLSWFAPAYSVGRQLMAELENWKVKNRSRRT